MWKKTIFAVVLVTFVGLQFANSLTCYTCNTPNGCRNPVVRTCDNNTARETTSWLAYTHYNVPNVAGSQTFGCMSLAYYSSNNVSTNDIRGCYFPSIPVCNLNASIYYYKKTCRTCNTNQCNPAGTFSKSVYTIVTSIVALFLAKMLR